MAHMHELTTISFSHYNEKARWALDRFDVPFVEHAFLPVLHVAGVLRLAPRFGLGKPDKESTAFSTPVLVTDDDRCIRDSSAIVRYASDRFARQGVDDLYFDPEVVELEARFSQQLGVHSRRFGYYHLFDDEPLVHRLARRNAGPRQAWIFSRMVPMVRPMLVSLLKIDAERAARSEAKIRTMVDEVSARIAGRRYLVGDRFSAADIAFASMLAPAICVSPEEGYAATFPTLDECPPGYRALALDVRASPAGAFALRLFREERRRDPAAQSLPL